MRKMWRPAACVLSLCLALSASGCFTGQEYAAESGALIRPGMSMQEVADRLGNPAQVIRGEPGTETIWVYRYQGGPSTGAVVVGVILFVAIIAAVALSHGGGGSFGGGGGGSDGPPCQVRLRFDPDGRLIDFTSPQPVPGAP